MNRVICRRHPEAPSPALERRPFKSELGKRIQREICAPCWRDWVQHQTLLMNHFGLNPRDPDARNFLYAQIRAVLFGEGEVAEIDSARKGTVGPPGK